MSTPQRSKCLTAAVVEPAGPLRSLTGRLLPPLLVRVPVPEDVLQIPKVVQQELEFDLSKLTEEERAAIGHRKDLEAVSRYPVEELHARAVKAEAEIGSLMVYLMNKHGPGGVCEQKEKRGAVRAQLSMLRQLVDTLLQDEAKEEGARLEELVKYLRTVPTFNELSESVITSIAHSVEPQSFAEGDVILKKGQKGGAFYMIHSGEVGFSLNDDGKMNKSRGKSEFFGEIGLMSDDHLVTATAIAKTACECYVLSKARFDELVRESMKALTGARDMPVRTRSKTEVAEASYAKMGVKTKQKTSLVSESFKTVHRCVHDGPRRSAQTVLRLPCWTNPFWDPEPPMRRSMPKPTPSARQYHPPCGPRLSPRCVVAD